LNNYLDLTLQLK